MKIQRIAAATVAIVILAGAAALYLQSRKTPVSLAPAWQLTPPNRYRGMQTTDPFVSWSPDSRALLLSVHTLNPFRSLILRWKVGEKRLGLVTEGTSANYMDSSRRFIYLKTHPPRLFVFDLATGKEEQVLEELTRDHPWSDAKAFIYDHRRRVLALRLTDYTQFFFPGSEDYSLDGRNLGSTASGLDSQTLAYSESRNGRFVAAVRALDIRGRNVLNVLDPEGQERRVASGYIGAIDWKPDEDVLAYGDVSDVVLFRPADGSKLVVAKLGPPPDRPDNRYVSRLKWSPNGDYLAVMVYVPHQAGDYPLIYVLNLSKIRWD